jgi:thiol-disulfide isomerase/thioredoxin
MTSLMKATIIAAAGALAAVIAFTLSGRAGDVQLQPELRGKVVLVNFWATYCASCLHEMPKLVETHKKFAARGLETLAVAVHKDDPARVAQFAKALPFNVTFDRSGELSRQFGNVRVTPSSFLIDKQGRVLRRYVGQPDWSELHDLVERALGS